MERPEIENFILDGLPAAHAEYRTAPGLFRYAQALENYIDWILEQEINLRIELINQRLELKKALENECFCLIDCQNCGAKGIKPLCMGNECCPKCFS